MQYPGQESDHLLSLLRATRGASREEKTTRLEIPEQTRFAHQHLLNCWNQAVLVPCPGHRIPSPLIEGASELTVRHNPLVASGWFHPAAQVVSTPESPG